MLRTQKEIDNAKKVYVVRLKNDLENISVYSSKNQLLDRLNEFRTIIGRHLLMDILLEKTQFEISGYIVTETLMNL